MSDATRPGTDLRTLTEAECLERLRSEPVGRFAFHDGDGIAVLPVNHLADVRTIRFRTSGGSKLAAAVERQPCTFEVDRYDHVAGTGWSVNARGIAHLEWDEEEITEVYASALTPYADADRRHVIVRIDVYAVSGRAID